MGEVNIVNNGKPYFFRFDIAKEGGMDARITDYLKTRVNDNGKKVPVKWFDQGQVMNVHGMSPFIQGGVGHWTPDENNELLPGSDVVYRDWQGTPSDVTDDGMVYYTLEDQFFCKQGQFKGIFGLRDANGNVFSSVNIIFEIQGNDFRIHQTTEYYSSELEKMKAKFANDTGQVIKEARDAYKQDLKASHDASVTAQVALEKVQATANELATQIESQNNNIKTHNIVTIDDFNKNADKLEKSIQAKLAQINSTIPVFSDLESIEKTYPKGYSGLVLTKDMHKWLYQDGNWHDYGVYDISTSGLNTKFTEVDSGVSSIVSSMQKITSNLMTKWKLGTLDPKTLSFEAHITSSFIWSDKIKVNGKQLFEITVPAGYFSTILNYDKHNNLIKQSNLPKTNGSTKQYFLSEDLAESVIIGFIADPKIPIGNDELVKFVANLKIKMSNKFDVANNILNKLSVDGLERIKATQGQSINDNVDYGTFIDITKPSSTTAYQNWIIPVQPNDVTYIANLQGATNALAWVYLNAKGQLIAKSATSLNMKNEFLVAPDDAATLILNSYVDGEVYSVTSLDNKQIDIYPSTNINRNINLNMDNGSIINMNYEHVDNYHTVTLQVNADDEFKITGRGGNNPRLWGFIDDNNRLITKAKANVEGTFEIKAPKLATKIIININGDGSIYRLPKGTIKTNTNYKNLVPQPVDTTILAFANGQKMATDLNSPLTDFKKDGDKMVHVSTFYIIDDVVYMTYYANETEAKEDPYHHTARLVISPLNNLSDKKFIDVAQIGDQFRGQPISAIYDVVIMKEQGEKSAFIVSYTAKIGDQYYLLYKTYDIQKAQLSNAEVMSFKAGALKADFTTENLHQLLAQNGIDYLNHNYDISIMQKLSTRVENGTTYYYIGFGLHEDFNFIAKSSDLVNWVYVSAPTWKYKGQYEPAVYVLNDKVYYCCRQYGSPYAVLATYNIPGDSWSDPVLVPDTGSRSDFIFKDGNLYLIHAPLDRNHISFMKIAEDYIEKSYEIQSAVVNDCFYPFVNLNNNDVYMSVTQSRQHIWLARINIGYNGIDAIKITK